MESNELRRVGLKVTHPRVRILELLEEKQPQHHLTAEAIYRRLLEQGDEIGLATVYRVLTQFEAAGLVIKHNFEGGQAIYELDRGDHHDHMVDLDTGKIIEFESAEIGLVTVYRVRTRCVAAGLVFKHYSEGVHAIFELDRGDHHDHMVDLDTGKIIEFESAEIEKLQREIAARHGYELEDHSLVLYVRKPRR